jgi:hypothetical protein
VNDAKMMPNAQRKRSLSKMSRTEVKNSFTPVFSAVIAFFVPLVAAVAVGLVTLLAIIN